MKTKQQVFDAIRDNGELWYRESNDFIDARDFERLANFCSDEQGLSILGYSLKEGATIDDANITDWTEENIAKQLIEDASFGLEKANDQRGLSSIVMWEVVGMWLWILENDSLPYGENEVYDNYGAGRFKRVLKHFGKLDS